MQSIFNVSAFRMKLAHEFAECRNRCARQDAKKKACARSLASDTVHRHTSAVLNMSERLPVACRMLGRQWNLAFKQPVDVAGQPQVKVR